MKNDALQVGNKTQQVGEIVQDAEGAHRYERTSHEQWRESLTRIAFCARDAGELQGKDFFQDTEAYRMIIGTGAAGEYIGVSVSELQRYKDQKDTFSRTVSIFYPNATHIEATLVFSYTETGLSELFAPSTFTIDFGDSSTECTYQYTHIKGKSPEDIMVTQGVLYATEELLSYSDRMRLVDPYEMLYGETPDADLLRAYIEGYVGGRAVVDERSRIALAVSEDETFSEGGVLQYPAHMFDYEETLRLAKERIRAELMEERFAEVPVLLANNDMAQLINRAPTVIL